MEAPGEPALPLECRLSLACSGGRGSLLPDPSGMGSSTGWAGPWSGLRPLTVYPPQMELKALKDQLEAERQAWVASCAKKEVGRAGPGQVGRCSGLPGRFLLVVWTSVEPAAHCPHGSRTVRVGTRGSGARDILET